MSRDFNDGEARSDPTAPVQLELVYDQEPPPAEEQRRSHPHAEREALGGERPLVGKQASLPSPADDPERWLTDEQELAVARREGSLLLAAGAGSGKTSVLVERFVRAVRDDGVAPGRILAITFTERAAGELRERVRVRLLGLGEREGAREAEAASVCTFHGFCARLLRTHPLQAGVEPGFQILDEGFAGQLRALAFREALAAFLDGERTEAVDLVAAYGADPLRSIVLGAYAQLRSQGQSQPRLPVLAAAAVDGGAGAGTGTRSSADEDDEDDGDDGGQARREADREEERAIRACELIGELVQRFGDAYAGRKHARAALDFDDLELDARGLLERRADVREQWAERFELLMVDEFQDSSPRQLQVLAALDRDNLFTVGDQLQSIYSFRHADVSLFRERQAQLGGLGASLALTRNFRSRPAILAAVERIFTERIGERFTPLVPTRPSQTVKEPIVELLLTDRRGWERLPTDDELAGLPAATPWRRAEARLLAARVAELIANGHAKAGEIVVLLRALGDMPVYESALRHHGLRTLAGVGGFWSHQQVGDLLAWLRALANPLDELALYATLASPLVGVSGDALALIGRAARERGRGVWEVIVERRERSSPEDGSWSGNVAGVRSGNAGSWSGDVAGSRSGNDGSWPGDVAGSRSGNDGSWPGDVAGSRGDVAGLRQGEDAGSGPEEDAGLRREEDVGLRLQDVLSAADHERIARFCELFVAERAAAPSHPIAELLRRAIAATRYDAHVLSLNWGERRLANVHKLVRLARRFEAREGRDLRGFLDHVAHLEVALDGREAEAPIGDGEVDAVRLMSIHAAKGLEFPVVCVADLGREPNLRVPDLLVDGADARVGLRLLELTSPEPVPALRYEELREERRIAQEEEEDRVLYVACTRAENRLLLSGAVAFERWPSPKPGVAPIAWLAPALAPDVPTLVASEAPTTGPTTLELGEGLSVRCVLNASGAAAPAAPARPSQPAGPRDVSAAPAPSAPVAQTPVPSVRVAQTPVPSVRVAQTPVPSVRVAQTPVPSVRVAQTPVPSVRVAQTPVPSVRVVQTPVPSAPVVQTPVPDPPAQPPVAPTPPLRPSLARPAGSPPLAGPDATMSYSSLAELERCGYRYYLERVLRLPENHAAARGARDEGGIEARTRGIIVHALLESVDFANPQPPTEQDVERVARRLGARVAAAERQEIVALIDSALAAEPARRLRAARRARREHPFAFSLGPAHPDEPLVTGVLDLIVEQPGGATLIVDYKSDRLDGGEDLELLVQRDYGFQRLLYALAAIEDGAQEVEVAHWFLERPEEWVRASFAAGEQDDLRERALARVARARNRGFVVTEAPHRALCLTCPGRGGLCSWGETHTMSERSAPLESGAQRSRLNG